MGHIIEFKGKNRSSVFDLNLLFQEGKTFIMDNHLAASWCWSQIIDLNKSYNLYHIDRHYDLLYSRIDEWEKRFKEENVRFDSDTIEKLLSIEYKNSDCEGQIIRFDNYIDIFNRLYPNVFKSSQIFFATHKEINYDKSVWSLTEKEIYELPINLGFWIQNDSEQFKRKTIVNLDIDYFFTTSYDDEIFQFLTDEYILQIAKQIKQAWEYIDVLTIALSPETSGGWDIALEKCEIIANELEINFSI